MELLLAGALRCNRVYDENLLKGSFIDGIQDSFCRGMCLLWDFKKHAKVPDLPCHRTFLASLQNCLILAERSRNSDKLGDHGDNRKSQREAAMILDTDGTSTPLVYGTWNTPNIALVIIMVPAGSTENATLESSTVTSATIASSAVKVTNIVYACRVLIGHRPSCCLMKWWKRHYEQQNHQLGDHSTNNHISPKNA